MTHVLVLNQDYQAVSLCGPERAMVLICLDKAELVAARPGRYLHSIRERFAFPSVIRLRRYVQLPYRPVPMTRDNILRRDGYRCAYCGRSGALTLDHVLPRAQGGRSTWTNLVAACQPCNAAKGDRSPEEANMPLRQRPFRPGFIMFVSHYDKGLDEHWKPFLYMT